MPIELHCSKCSKLIRAPDNAGGKYGKCPYCQNKVYVPAPADQIEEIPLAPIDEEQDRRDAQAQRDSARTAAALAHEVDSPKDTPSNGTPSPLAASDFAAEVKNYILAMRDSKLEDAQGVVHRMRNAGKPALSYVTKLMKSDAPINIDNVPPPLAKGFLKTLLSDLG